MKVIGREEEEEWWKNWREESNEEEWRQRILRALEESDNKDWCTKLYKIEKCLKS